jgi:hypothetical protein
MKTFWWIAIVLGVLGAALAIVACGDDDDDDSGRTDDDTDDDAADDDAGGGLTDNGDGTATDAASGLTWTTAASSEKFDWTAAVAYCDELTLAGGGWRLPTISELRTLIEGCDGTMTDGACGVTDSCLENACKNASCYACENGGGPNDGCYAPAVLTGPCESYWSASEVADNEGVAWYVSFNDGHVWAYGFGNHYYARCVRP